MTSLFARTHYLPGACCTSSLEGQKPAALSSAVTRPRHDSATANHGKKNAGLATRHKNVTVTRTGERRRRPRCHHAVPQPPRRMGDAPMRVRRWPGVTKSTKVKIHSLSVKHESHGSVCVCCTSTTGDEPPRQTVRCGTEPNRAAPRRAALHNRYTRGFCPCCATHARTGLDH